MLGTFLKSIYQAATSQVCPSRRARPPTHSSRSARPTGVANLTFSKLPLGKWYIWEVDTWEIVTWKVALGKMPVVTTSKRN